MRIAIIVHAFHKDSYKLIRDYLNNLYTPVDVFVTTPSFFEFSDKKIKGLVAIDVVENAGMDVIPFLSIVRNRQLWKYDLVVKIHSKNCHSENTLRMMRIYLDSLVTDHALIAIQTSSEKNSNHVGIWGPIAYARAVDKLAYRNRENLRNLEKLMGYYCSDKSAVFFAGTMFCIRGFLLKRLSEQFYVIKNMDNQIMGNVLTGGDGLIAHALERFFSYVVSSQSYGVGYIFPHWFSPNGNPLIINSELLSFSLYKRYFQAGSHDTSSRLEKVEECKKINYGELIDFEDYMNFIDPRRNLHIDYVAHYLFFSDYLVMPIGIERGFSSALYSISRPDVFRIGGISPCHYLMRGKKERPWMFLCQWANGIHTKFFNRKKKVVKGDENSDFRSCFKELGEVCMRNSSKQFSPLINESKSELVEESIPVLKLFEHHFPEFIRTRDIVKLQTRHYDYVGILNSVEEFSQHTFLTTDLVEMLAVANTMEFNWEFAVHYWEVYQQSKNNVNLLPGFNGSRIIEYDADYDAKKIFQKFSSVLNIYEIDDTLSASKKVCIYTSLFGDYDDFPKIDCEVPDNIDFIVFTDHFHEFADKRWKQKICRPDYSSNNMSAKKYKIKPHVYLEKYEYSLFVDANTVFTGNISKLLHVLCLSGPFVMWRHPFRTDLYKEACAILAFDKAKPKSIIRQIDKYSKLGIGHDTGLCEGSFIWRRHKDKRVSKFMDEWWHHIVKYSHRDQLSLCFLMWRDNYYPALMSDSYGTSRENIFFHKTRHKAELLESCQT